MKKMLFIVPAIVFCLNSLSAQIIGLVPDINNQQETIRNKGIRKCKIIFKDYKRGKLVYEYIGEIDNYNKNGYLSSAEEFLNTGEFCWRTDYNYDKQNKLIKKEWVHDHKGQIKSIYSYDQSGHLTRIDEYDRKGRNPLYQLSRSQLIHYKDDKINLITNSNGDSLYYYLYKEIWAYKCIPGGLYVESYENGRFVESYSKIEVIYFYYNAKGELNRTLTNNPNGEKIIETFYYYEDFLLTKKKSYDKNDVLLYERDYIYE